MMREGTLVYPKRPTIAPADAVPVLDSRETKLVLLMGLAHLPLGLLLYNAGSVAILHPITVFGVGIYWALQRKYSLNRVALAAGYLIGSEVLWRMAQIPVYWEFGKYGTAAIMLLALFVRGRFNIPKPALIYFLALIPGCIITASRYPVSELPGHFSFTMSGPFALVICCWFFSNIRLEWFPLRRILFAVILPLLSVAGVTLFYTVSAQEISFTGESNFATSGGFGPNQVSAMLGLGVFMSAAGLMVFKSRTSLKIALIVATVLFTAQSVLTFSRGGIYNAVGALTILSLLNFRNIADGMKRVLPIIFAAIIFLYVFFPLLNNFTGGALQERFEDTGTSNRTEIIDSDIQIFFENPVFGAGVGGSGALRKQILGFSAVSHTEFSRLLSEHGAFGLIALVCLIGIAITNILRQRSILGRALLAGAAVWSILFMFNAGMRLAAPSFLLGLTYISILGGPPFRRPGRLSPSTKLNPTRKERPIKKIA